MLQAVRAGTYTLNPADWSGVSEDAKDLVRSLLVMDPEKRPTAAQAAQHVWLKVETVAALRPEEAALVNQPGT